MKMLLALGLIGLLSLVSVSALEITQDKAIYNPIKNEVKVTFTENIYKECPSYIITIRDRKGNIVGKQSESFKICKIIQNGKVLMDNGRTGEFKKDFTIDLIKRKDIKGIGRMTYEIQRTFDDNILKKGRVRIRLR